MPLQYFVGYEPTGDEETGPDGGQEFDGKVWCVDTDARGPEGDIDPDVSVLFHVGREQDAKDIVALLEERDALQQQHAEDERMLQEAYAALSLGPVKGVCSWCGLELLGDADPQARMKRHLYECQKHPMRAVEEYAAALKAIYEIRTKMFVARCGGTVRDTTTEGEFIQAAIRLEKAEDALPKP